MSSCGEVLDIVTIDSTNQVRKVLMQIGTRTAFGYLNCVPIKVHMEPIIREVTLTNVQLLGTPNPGVFSCHVLLTGRGWPSVVNM